MTRAAPLAPLLVFLALATAGDRLDAQARPHEVECSFLLLSGCRSYVLEVVRVEPDGTERVQPPSDTYAVVDPDTLDPARYLVLETYVEDRLEGERAVVWVERAAGAVGGNWPSVLSNDAVRSAVLRGVPGDVVEMHDDRARGRSGRARLVIFAGREECRTETNLDDRGGGCSTVQGGGVAGKVSAITIKYRAPAPEPAVPGVVAPARPAPEGLTPAPPDSVAPRVPDGLPPAPRDTLPRAAPD